MTIDLERDRLTLTAVAKLLDLNVSTVSRWCTRGIKIGVDDAGESVRLKLPSFRFGGTKCVYRDDLETFLTALNAGGEEDDPTPAKPSKQSKHRNEAAKAKLDSLGIGT